MSNFNEQLQTAASQIVLTAEEKSAMRAALSRAMQTPRERRAIPSPYLRFIFISRLTLVSVLALMIIGSGTAYAAGNALPGDPLYIVKTGALEPFVGALQFSTGAKAAWHAQVAATRLKEAETLAARGTLTASDAQEIEDNFEANANVAQQLALESEREDPSQDDTLGATIQAEINAHSAVLLTLASATTTADVDKPALVLAMHVHALLAFSGRARSHALAGAFTESQSQPKILNGGIHTSPTSLTSGMATSTTIGIAVSGEGFASSASATSVTSSASIASSTLTVTQEGIGNEAHAGAVAAARARADAIEAIDSVQAQMKEASLDAATQAQITAGLASAKSAIAAGDGALGAQVADQYYLQALKEAVSLKTYLTADARFPQAHLLPVLLTTGDNSDSQNSQPQ